MTASTNVTKVLTRAYKESLVTAPPQFLSGFFGKNQSEIYISNNIKVEVDIQRDEELIAIDVVRGSDGNQNLKERFSTKEYTPPLYNEYGPITASMMNKRSPGVNPFEEENPMVKFKRIATDFLVQMTKKIFRAIEKQAAEALFYGIITLKNTESLDFKRKSTHNITPVKLWTDTTDGNPIADLKAACEINKIDGKLTSNICIMGSSAWDAFIVHPKVTSYLDNRRIEAGGINPSFSGEGSTFQGVLWVGDYRLEIYTYPQFYKATEAASATPYVPIDQVVVFNGNATLIKAFAALDMLPIFEGGVDSLGISVPTLVREMFASYLVPNAPHNVKAGVQSAPIVIPTAIDTICNINAA